MADRKQDEEQAEQQQSNGEEQAEGQPSTDPTVHYADVEPGAVGQATEEPRPDPTEEIKERYQDSEAGAGQQRADDDDEDDEKS